MLQIVNIRHVLEEIEELKPRSELEALRLKEKKERCDVRLSFLMKQAEELHPAEDVRRAFALIDEQEGREEQEEREVEIDTDAERILNASAEERLVAGGELAVGGQAGENNNKKKRANDGSGPSPARYHGASHRCR